MKKKVLAVLLGGCMVAGLLAGCGGGNNGGGSDSSADSSSDGASSGGGDYHETLRSCTRLLRATRLQFVSLIRRFMSSFRQRKRTSRNWLMLRARQLSRSKRSSMDFTSSTR